MGVLKTIFFIVLFYYIFKILAKIFAPFLVKKMTDTMQKKAAEQFRNQQPEPSVKEGETIIDKAPKKNQQSKGSVGEYVDFEEVD